MAEQNPSDIISPLTFFQSSAPEYSIHVQNIKTGDSKVEKEYVRFHWFGEDDHLKLGSNDLQNPLPKGSHVQPLPPNSVIALHTLQAALPDGGHW